MEKKQTTRTLLNREAEEVNVSRKFRKELMDQYLRKVRWRFPSNGSRDEEDIESNARLVEWEDGSYGIYVGDKYYDIEGESPHNQMVYTVNDDLMVLQNRIGYGGNIRQFKLPTV